MQTDEDCDLERELVRERLARRAAVASETST
jgi:hypothetical protein